MNFTMENGSSSLPKYKRTKAQKSGRPPEPKNKLSKNGNQSPPKYKRCQICAQSPNPPETSQRLTTNPQLEAHKVKYHSEQYFLPYFFPNWKPNSESPVPAQFKNSCDRFLFAEIFVSFKNLKCLYCPLKISAYFSRQTLRVHLLTVHLEELAEKLKKQQNKQLTEEKAEGHVERNLNPSTSPIPEGLTCKQCGILFTEPSGLACHLLTHQPPLFQQTSLIKPINQCPDCGKSVQKKNLKKHQQKSCPKKLYYNLTSITNSSNIVSTNNITDQLTIKLPKHLNIIPVDKVQSKVDKPEIINLVDEHSIKVEDEENYEMILPD